MSEFIAFSKGVSKQFECMKKHQLYRVSVSKEDRWDASGSERSRRYGCQVCGRAERNRETTSSAAQRVCVETNFQVVSCI